jgi:biopolymer transport protein ExbD
MTLLMPDDKGDAMPTKEGGALTLLPTINGALYYYEGKFQKANLKATTLKEVRDIIIDKKKRTEEKDMFVIIKPANKSAYGDIVNVLDEMTINDIKRYALVDITKEEEAYMK